MFHLIHEVPYQYQPMWTARALLVILINI